MLYKLGRFLQIVGMILLPVAIAGNVAREEIVTLKVSLMISGIGIVIFLVGWWLQQAAKAK